MGSKKKAKKVSKDADPKPVKVTIGFSKEQQVRRKPAKDKK